MKKRSKAGGERLKGRRRKAPKPKRRNASKIVPRFQSVASWRADGGRAAYPRAGTRPWSSRPRLAMCSRSSAVRLHHSWWQRRRCRRRDRLRGGGFVSVLMMIALAGIIGAPSVAGFQRRHRWRRFFLGLRLASAHIRHLERNPGASNTSSLKFARTIEVPLSGSLWSCDTTFNKQPDQRRRAYGREWNK